jgi:hypothetical protein
MLVHARDGRLRGAGHLRLGLGLRLGHDVAVAALAPSFGDARSNCAVLLSLERA